MGHCVRNRTEDLLAFVLAALPTSMNDLGYILFGQGSALSPCLSRRAIADTHPVRGVRPVPQVLPRAYTTPTDTGRTQVESKPSK